MFGVLGSALVNFGALLAQTTSGGDTTTQLATGGTLVVVLGLVITFATKQILDQRRSRHDEEALRDAAQSSLVDPLTDENRRLRAALKDRDAEVDRLRLRIYERDVLTFKLRALLQRNNIELPEELQ